MTATMTRVRSIQTTSSSLQATRTRTGGKLLTAKRVPAIVRSNIAAWFAARATVRDGMNAIEFLRHRASEYARQLGDAGWQLPVSVVLERGEIKVSDHPVAPIRRETSISHFSGPREDAQEKLEQLAADIEVATRAAAQAEAEVSEAARKVRAAGQEDLPPHVPSAGPGALWTGAAVCLTLAEAYQLALPYLDSNGIDTTNLFADLAATWPTVLTGSALGVGATASMAYLAHKSKASFGLVLATLEGPRAVRFIADATLMVFFAAVEVGLALGIAQLRRAAGEGALGLHAARAGGSAAAGAALSLFTFLALTAIIPWIAAAAWEHGRELSLAREAVAKLHQGWQERRRSQEQVVTDQRQALTALQQKVALLKRERETTQSAARSWETAIAVEEHGRADGQSLHGEALSRAALHLKAGLDKDLYFFRRRARHQGQPGLLPEDGPPISLYEPQDTRPLEVVTGGRS